MRAKPQTERLAVERLELVEAASVDEARDQLADVVSLAVVGRDDTVEAPPIVERLLGQQHVPAAPACGGGGLHDLACEGECVLVADRVVVGHGDARVTSAPPGSSALTSSPVAAFIERRAAQKVVLVPRTITVLVIAGT